MLRLLLNHRTTHHTSNSKNSTRSSEFQETADEKVSDKKIQKLLSQKISDLSLTIKNSRLEAFIDELYQELERAGISFKPKSYLTDGWGCPNKVPAIGIPFYLADQKLYSLQAQFTGTKVEDEKEVMMFLRHEAGHALNYAYRLYRKPEWHRLFGRFSQPYKDDYKTDPFSPRFVHHFSGWYAQKHPDDDFAETFAVWLTPNSEWQKRYNGTPALAKLLYVDKMAWKYGQQPPVITEGKLDMPLQEMTITLDEWFTKCKNTKHVSFLVRNAPNNETF